MPLVQQLHDLAQKIFGHQRIQEHTHEAKNAYFTAQRGEAEEKANTLNILLQNSVAPAHEILIPGGKVSYTSDTKDGGIRLQLKDMVTYAETKSPATKEQIKALAAATPEQELAEKLRAAIWRFEGAAREMAKSRAKTTTTFEVTVENTSPPAPITPADVWGQVKQFLKVHDEMAGVEEVDHYDPHILEQLAGNRVSFCYVKVLDQHDKRKNAHLKDGKPPDQIEGTVSKVAQNRDGFWYLTMRNENLIINGERQEIPEDEIGRAAEVGLVTVEQPGENAISSYRIAGIVPNTLTELAGGHTYLFLTKKAVMEGRIKVKKAGYPDFTFATIKE